MAAAPVAPPSPARPDQKPSATVFGRERETAMFGSDDAPRSVAFKPLALPQQERPLFNAIEPMPRIRQTERPFVQSAPAAEMARRFNRQPSATDLEFRMPRPPMASTLAGTFAPPMDSKPAASGAVPMPATIPAPGLSGDGHAADFAAAPHSPVELASVELEVPPYTMAVAPSDLAEAEVDLAGLFGTEPVTPAVVAPAVTSPLSAGPRHSGEVLQAIDQPLQTGQADPGVDQHAYTPPVPLPDLAAPLIELPHPLGSPKVRRVRKIVIAPTHPQQQADAAAMPSAFDHQPAHAAGVPFDLPLPGLDELLDEQFMEIGRAHV